MLKEWDYTYTIPCSNEPVVWLKRTVHYQYKNDKNKMENYDKRSKKILYDFLDILKLSNEKLLLNQKDELKEFNIILGILKRSLFINCGSKIIYEPFLNEINKFIDVTLPHCKNNRINKKIFKKRGNKIRHFIQVYKLKSVIDFYINYSIKKHNYTTFIIDEPNVKKSPQMRFSTSTINFITSIGSSRDCETVPKADKKIQNNLDSHIKKQIEMLKRYDINAIIGIHNNIICYSNPNENNSQLFSGLKTHFYFYSHSSRGGIVTPSTERSVVSDNGGD